jgi:hypothetical protein
MTSVAARRAGLLLGATLFVGACGHQHSFGGDNDEINVYPGNYKTDMLAAMHAYLSDPTGIRDAAISPPVLKPYGSGTRYAACLRFNPKKNAKDYAGVKEIAGIFLVGRFDQFIETPKDQCSDVVYAPFPELQKLPP